MPAIALDSSAANLGLESPLLLDSSSELDPYGVMSPLEGSLIFPLFPPLLPALQSQSHESRINFNCFSVDEGSLNLKLSLFFSSKVWGLWTSCHWLSSFYYPILTFVLGWIFTEEVLNVSQNNSWALWSPTLGFCICLFQGCRINHVVNLLAR